MIVEGGIATTTDTAHSGEPLKYTIEGNIDEWGNFVQYPLDELGRHVLAEQSLNERGDWVDIFFELDISKVFGEQAITTEIANEGLILSANVVNGAVATNTDTPNAGGTFVHINVFGDSAGTTDVANAGIEFKETVVLGSQTSTTETAHEGGSFVEVDVSGGSATTIEESHEGEFFIEVFVAGGTASTNETVTSNDEYTLVDFGDGASTTEIPRNGTIVLPSLIRVQGSSATTTDTAESGSFGVSELIVTGSHVLLFETANKGKALGGAPRYRVLIDKEVYHDTPTA